VATYYAGPDASGTGTTEGSPARLGTLLSIANPGDTIILLDGTYRGATNLLKPPSGRNGQPGAYITVTAKNDGAVLFDGEFGTIAVSLSKNSWWKLEGFNARHGEVEVLRIGEQSNNVIVRRVVAWDAWIHGNTIVCGVHFVNGPVLFEDVACFGTGRKTLGPTQDVGVSSGTTGFTCRRCWSRFDGSISTGPSGASMSYNTWNMIYENLLARFSATQMPATYTVLDSWPPHSIYSPNIVCGPGGTGQCGGTGQIFGFKWAAGFERQDRNFETNGKLLGSLAYVLKDDPLWFNHAWAHCGQGFGGMSNVTIKNVYGFIHPQNPRFNAADTSSKAAAYENPFGGGVNLNVDRVTHVGGFKAHSAWNITNNFSGNLASALPNPWTTTTGANLCKRYVDGVLTSEPLWPWPMNERIKAATERAGRYSGPCPGCSGGFTVERTATDVTAEIESILGPIPSECSSSVGSPPGTGGSARGVAGIDTVSRSEFVSLDSGQRLINVSDTDFVTERVRFPFTVAQPPSDTSEAGNRGHALTWLVDASLLTGTGLTAADLRYAALDVEVLDPPYQARLVENPVVTRELMDTFWGITEVSSITITLGNADGRLTPLYAADPRDQMIVLRRLDYRSGQVIDELNARITSVSAGVGTVILTATSPDLSVLERELPAALVTRDAYPNAIDIGAVIPVVFGQVAKVPLPYVKETSTTFEYLVGHGTIAVTGVYYIRSDNTYTLIPTSEYEVSTTLYPGYTAIKFASRRMDITNGSLLQVVADVEGPIRHFVRAIQELLVGENAWGLNGSAGPINVASFDTAAADLDQVGLFCDGVLREQRQVQDILRDLMVVRGIRLAFNAAGEWTIKVDTQKTGAAIAIADGLGDGGRTILSAGQRSRPGIGNAISDYILRYRPEYVRGVYLSARERVVNASFGRNRTIESPFIRDHATADKVIDYLARRERIGVETVEVSVTQEGRALLEGDIVEITYGPLQYEHDLLEVRRATKRLQAIDLELASWSDEIYVYGPEPLPTDVITDEVDATIPPPTNITGQIIDCAMVISWNHVTPTTVSIPAQ
jgi:hypothetical protein